MGGRDLFYMLTASSFQIYIQTDRAWHCKFIQPSMTSMIIPRVKCIAAKEEALQGEEFTQTVLISPSDQSDICMHGWDQG